MRFSSSTLVRVLAYALIMMALFYVVVPALNSQGTNPEPAKVANEPAKTVEPAKEAEKNEQPTQAPKKSSGLIDLFVVGGWSMWPLLLSSIIGFGVAFERVYFYYTNKLAGKGFNQELGDSIEAGGLEGAIKYLESKKEEKIAQVLLDGNEVAQGDPELFAKGVEREAGEVLTLLERGLTILASVSTIAPLIGFLGTVSGMINAFDAIANADQVNAKVVAGGIKEALITTAAGLIVAIPTMSFYQYLTGKVNSFASEIEEAANQIYKEYLKKQAKAVSGKN